MIHFKTFTHYGTQNVEALVDGCFKRNLAGFVVEPIIHCFYFGESFILTVKLPREDGEPHSNSDEIVWKKFLTYLTPQDLLRLVEVVGGHGVEQGKKQRSAEFLALLGVVK